MPDTFPTRWAPERRAPSSAWPQPPLLRALLRGALGRCPACGGAPLFAGWLRVREACPVCAAPLGRLRADDAPPYIVVFLVGHVVVGTQFALERYAGISIGAEIALLLPLTVGLALGLLRPVKGAVVGLMLRLGMLPEAARGG